MNEVSNYANLFLLIIGKIRLIRCFLSTPIHNVREIKQRVL